MSRTVRAYCFASGQIEFGLRVPDGALVIARGPEAELREYIAGVARHGYRTRLQGGRPIKIEGSDTLLVPGLPEAPNQIVAKSRLEHWLKLIDIKAPKGVRVLPR
ncbi:host nuclease inhibitor protein [Bradyrhizobium sp.]|uniref:host nuclease inhibitor protein n=1 Tax=Bradyrhizobium sp. TaxID=376 RepID=UPI0039E4CEF6